MKWQLTLIAVFALSMVAQRADAQCCARCGCQDNCKKTTCKIVCEKKKVKETFYCCECEDFCIPGPAPCKKLCDKCNGSGCKSCCESQTCDCSTKPAYCNWFKKKNLIKYECEKEIPVYKCVIVPLCSGCQSCVEKDGGVIHEAPAPPKAPAPASASYQQGVRSDLSPLLIP